MEADDVHCGIFRIGASKAFNTGRTARTRSIPQVENPYTRWRHAAPACDASFDEPERLVRLRASVRKALVFSSKNRRQVRAPPNGPVSF
jgi:hypothetical protein